MVETSAAFIASHALVLLGAGIVLLCLGLLAVLAAARLALRYRDRLWAAVDWIVPGTRLRPTAYLVAHLVIALFLVLGAMGFAAVADEVFDDEEIAAFDVALAEALEAETTPGARRLFVAITTLGNGAVLTAFSTAVAVPLFVARRTLLGLSWVLAQAGGALLSYGLKMTFARARPPYADPELAARSFSFPSGHAMMTFVFCGMAAYLLIRTRRSWPVAASLTTIVLVWCALMGFSRLYLGQHYLSDVIAGLCAGTAWVAACVAGTEVVLRRAARTAPSMRVPTRSASPD